MILIIIAVICIFIAVVLIINNFDFLPGFFIFVAIVLILFAIFSPGDLYVDKVVEEYDIASLSVENVKEEISCLGRNNKDGAFSYLTIKENGFDLKTIPKESTIIVAEEKGVTQPTLTVLETSYGDNKVHTYKFIFSKSDLKAVKAIFDGYLFEQYELVQLSNANEETNPIYYSRQPDGSINYIKIFKNGDFMNWGPETLSSKSSVIIFESSLFTKPVLNVYEAVDKLPKTYVFYLPNGENNPTYEAEK